jgi:hypothetical protein
VIVSRTLHRSLLLGLVLAGLTPVWLRPPVDDLGMPRGLTAPILADGLTAAPDAVAVFVGDPSYVGTLADLEGLAAVAHAHSWDGRGPGSGRTAYLSSWTPPGEPTSASTPRCPGTPWTVAPTRW